jgi:cellulose biosynthesis protein BcsQ
MAKKISLFNHKGGVSKTTITFHLGWMLAEQGKRTILVDADPQCNLTGLILGYKQTELEDFYSSGGNNNLRDGLAPAFESRPSPIEAVNCFDCSEINGPKGLFLLPGNIGLAEYDVMLGMAQQNSSAILTLQNLPGAINYLLNKTAEKYEAEYILIDMSPSLSSINQNLLMISDFFIVPTTPDYYSLMAIDSIILAIDSLAMIFDKWDKWSKRIQGMDMSKESVYPFPEVTPKLLGTIIQKFHLRSDRPSKGFQNWIDEINKIVREKLVPKLKSLEMVMPEEYYKDIGMEDDYCLALIPDFNTLIAISQENQTPVFALTSEQIKQAKQTGMVLDTQLDNVNEFHKLFEELADKVIRLTESADSLMLASTENSSNMSALLI